MVSFLVCLVLLILSLFTYGKVTEKVFGPDDRKTPAVTKEDGVDYVKMPRWRVFLVQLLNIAGLGPIWGAVGGALWGPSVFLWITFGTIFVGGVHDFASGFMSLRNEGLSVSELSGKYMRGAFGNIMRVFSVVLLFMVGVVFAVGPAGLLAYLVGQNAEAGSIFANKTFWLAVVFIYFFIATFLPVDKIIGKIYPIFGICLIVMAIGVGIGIFAGGYTIPEILPLKNFHPSDTPIWSNMFIAVACGACSGFHSTQSPIMARCLGDERDSRRVFYGAMVAEGVIALVWAAASCALFPIVADKMTGLQEAMAVGQAGCVYNICNTTMGKFGAILAMLGVIACPISSGDTAFRSARLTIADWFKIDQKDIKKRLVITVFLLGLGVFVSTLDYNTVWNYFSSTNQILAAIVLWTGAFYLAYHNRQPLLCAIPAAFMTAVTLTFVLKSPLYFGKLLNLSNNTANIIAIFVSVGLLGLFLARKTRIDWHIKNKTPKTEKWH